MLPATYSFTRRPATLAQLTDVTADSDDSKTVFREWGPTSSSIIPTFEAPSSTFPISPTQVASSKTTPTVEEASSSQTARPDQQGARQQVRSCRLQKAGDASSAVTIAVTLAGLAVCLVFLRRAGFHWRSVQTQGNDRQSAGSPPLGPKASLSSSPRLGIDQPPPPSPVRRRGSSSSTAGSRRLPSEAALLLVAWIFFTLDQLSILGMVISLLWICPQFNCWNKPPAHTPGCPVPELFLSWHVLLSLGASVFVLATLQRFLRVYAILSRKRYMFLCACTVLVVIVLLGRLAVIAFHTFVRLSSYSTWNVNSPMRRLASRVNRISYLVYFFSMAVLALVALLLGLQFVLNVRSDLVRIHRQSSASPISPTFSLSSPGFASPIASAVVLTSYAPEDELAHRHLQQRIRRRRRVVIAWLLVSILMLFNFGLVALVPKDDIPMPVNLFNALLLLLVKALVAAVSMAMSEVVKLATVGDQEGACGGRDGR
ncbi:hypothetical protein BCR44DRAFT_90852 [Catenaria anguillulae PL171]|uniref:Uncharacterized protein n=1 Tax=Catenaria anguillulae PL171 TaxID=765915 RepID=A0A1Y2HJ47_9FUNG|nr:hypothetical protein BCR44DRAFT_90852 [Catenaria anguillulae PL171]